MKNSKTTSDERTALINETVDYYSNDNNDSIRNPATTSFVNVDIGKDNIHRKPSSLEWTNSPWTQWMYILFWWWLNPLLILGYKQTLTDDNLDDLRPKDKCSFLLNKLMIYDWSAAATTWRIILKAFAKETFLVGLMLLPYIGARVAQPLFLRALVQQLGEMQPMPSNSRWIAAFVVGLLLCSIVHVIVSRQFFFRSALLGYRIRQALSSIIYRHLLSIQISSIQKNTSGQITNILAHDTSKFEDFWTDGHFLWAGPLEILITFGMLCWIIGFLPTLFSFITILLLSPIQLIFSKLFTYYRSITMMNADTRVKTFSEILYGCQTIKMYSWEKSMEKRVLQMRKSELASIKVANHLRAFNMGLFFSSSCLLASVTFISLWFLGYPVKIGDVFATLSYFIQLRLPLFRLLPLTVEQVSNMLVASKRIDSFMKLKKMQSEGYWYSTTSLDTNVSKSGTIILSDASFSWESEPVHLSSINLTIHSGQFIGIVGSVGSGKSSLLAALLGEMNRINGKIQVNGTVSYAPQSPWIFTDTVRANIVFEKRFDEKRYQDIIRACSLDVDFVSFGEAGDLIVIGERGINLSGGQKARVSLARALYADADIYLLDDILSALDSKVAKHVFDACIGPHGFLREKTRLLVTHQRHFLVASDPTILLVNGHIEAQCPFSELPMLYDQINQMKNDLQENPIMDDTQEMEQDQFDWRNVTDDKKSIICNEIPSSDSISWSIWCRLFNANPMGYFGFALLIILLVLGEILYDISNHWLVYWYTEAYIAQKSSNLFPYVYIGLTLGVIIIAHLRAYYWFYILWCGSADLHNRMLQGILYSSMRFFESNPIGRILNRATRDQQIIDDVLPTIFFDAVQTLIITLGVVFIICIIEPFLIFVIILLLTICWFLRCFYMRSNRQMRHLESITRSPAYAFFSSSLEGVATIRAFKVQENFIETFMKFMDTHARAYITMTASTHWFNFHIDLIVLLFQLATTIATIVLSHEHKTPALGLILTYSFTLSQSLVRGMQQLATAEIHMISAQRIEEYALLPPEEDNGGDQGLVETEKDWPDQGIIEFKNYTMRYRNELEPVLNQINLHINSMEKIGIIGRTGRKKFC